MPKNRAVRVAEVPKDQKFNFSFQYYDMSSDKYCLSKWTSQQIRKCLDRLKDVSNKTFNELSASGNIYHFHQVVWERTTEKNGFPRCGVELFDPFQLALIGVNGQLARVYGAYSQGTFYIVWFDLNHGIWPSALKHT
ncbi:MAG: hypothetical protein Q8Q05_00500 [bacterium]|nr:hypothetical protein [bacterium]